MMANQGNSVDENGVVIPDGAAAPAPAIVDRLIDPPAFELGFNPDPALQAALEASLYQAPWVGVGADAQDPELKAALEASESELMARLAAQEAKDREERAEINHAKEVAVSKKWDSSLHKWRGARDVQNDLGMLFCKPVILNTHY